MNAVKAAWWPLSRKIRTVAAIALAGDAAAVVGGLNGTLSWTAALAAIITGTASAIGGYLTTS